jgi:glycosyltransferase involved in cell wall biosynthesis
MKKVSCIICAYNEGPRIGNILKVVMNNSLLDEIIVVNDGSVDNTEKEALKFKGIKFIGHEKNLGKSSSMLDGLNNAKNDIVMFLDADLIDMTMAMCNYDFVLNTFSKLFGVEVPNGQRAIKKEIAKEILKNAIGYSVELQMNQYILENNLKFLVVNWCNVKAPLKRKKDGIKKGFIGTIIGFKQLATKVPLTQIIKQMLIMGKLSNRYKKELNIK